MSDLFAILYAPGCGTSTTEGLINKLNNIIDTLDVGKTNIKVNPRLPICSYLDCKSNNLISIVIGWGLQDKPSWERIIPGPKCLGSVRQLIAIDLFERRGADGRILEKPMVNAGKYWGRKMQQNEHNLFFKGSFLQTTLPYGLKRVKVSDVELNNHSSLALFSLEPGEPSEVEVVRMIFDLFVDHDYNRSEICNLLNAQEVKAPKNSKVWNQNIIKTILLCPFYVGANRYRGFIKFDVFTPIIEKTVYFEAQAKMSQINIVSSNRNLIKYKLG
jgi:hypothetical protein